MSIGQFFTIATLIVAAAILGTSGYFAWRLAFDDQFFVSAVQAGWLKSVDDDRGLCAFFLVFLAFGATIGLVQFQQRCVLWFVERELRQMRGLYRDVENVLGTEAANAFLAYKVDQLRSRGGGGGWRAGVFG